VTTPEPLLGEIFDPYSTKPEKEPWNEFIRSQVESSGTFILEAYFKAMAGIAGDEGRRYEWVITQPDNIGEGGEGVELVGQAECFDPARI